MSFILTEELKERKYQDKLAILWSWVVNPRHIIIHINSEEMNRIAREEKELIFNIMILGFELENNTYTFSEIRKNEKK